MNDKKEELYSKYEVGGPFLIHLLFEEECAMPNPELIEETMNQHLGKIAFFYHDKDMAHFEANEYVAYYENENGPHEFAAQLMINGVVPVDSDMKRRLEKTYMWNCSGINDVTEVAKYQVIANDFLAGELDPMTRANLDMDFVEALVDLYPTCIGVWFASCGKLFSRKQIVEHKLSQRDRFIYFAVNVRLFNLKDSSDVLIDTVGMSTLKLPDLQYYFKKMDPNWVSNHAHNILLEMLENNSACDNNHEFGGMVNGKMNDNFKWTSEYVEALAKPDRVVININMGEYSAKK